MSRYNFCDLCGLIDTTYRHRRSTFGLSNTIDLEPSYAEVSEIHVDGRICCGWLVGRPFCCVARVRMKIEFSADTRFGYSVTIVSIIRLVYLIKLSQVSDATHIYTDVIIWTSVEANISIICGQ